MPGALTHIAAGLIAALAVHLYHFRLEYSMSVFVGSLLPDAIKFGFTAVRQVSWKIFSVEHDGFFLALADVTGSPANWFTLGFFVFALTGLLYHFHVIKEKRMEEYDELYAFLLAGILLHLVLDGMIVERGPWL